jgi:hypothetical protein
LIPQDLTNLHQRSMMVEAFIMTSPDDENKDEGAPDDETPETETEQEENVHSDDWQNDLPEPNSWEVLHR